MIQLIGIASALINVRGGGVASQSGIGLDGIDDFVQPSSSAGLINVKVVKPIGYVAQFGVGIPVFIEESAVFDFKSHVVDAISDSVD